MPTFRSKVRISKSIFSKYISYSSCLPSNLINETKPSFLGETEFNKFVDRVIRCDSYSFNEKLNIRFVNTVLDTLDTKGKWAKWLIVNKFLKEAEEYYRVGDKIRIWHLDKWWDIQIIRIDMDKIGLLCISGEYTGSTISWISESWKIKPVIGKFTSSDLAKIIYKKDLYIRRICPETQKYEEE